MTTSREGAINPEGPGRRPLPSPRGLCSEKNMPAMDTVELRPPTDRGPVTAPPPNLVEFHYNQTDRFAPLLRELGASLLVTTYQANKLLVARAAGPGLSTLV